MPTNIPIEHRKEIVAEAIFAVFSNPNYDGLGSDRFFNICKNIYEDKYSESSGKMYRWLKKYHPDIHNNMERWNNADLYYEKYPWAKPGNKEEEDK